MLCASTKVCEVELSPSRAPSRDCEFKPMRGGGGVRGLLSPLLQCLPSAIVQRGGGRQGR